MDRSKPVNYRITLSVGRRRKTWTGQASGVRAALLWLFGLLVTRLPGVYTETGR